MAGTPYKLEDSKLVDKVIQLLQEGNHLDIAAMASGVSTTAVRGWIRRGNEEEEGIYFEFAQRAKAALAVAEANIVAAVNNAAIGPQGDWRAGISILERRFPERWAKQDRTQIQITAPELSPEIVRNILGDETTRNRIRSLFIDIARVEIQVEEDTSPRIVEGELLESNESSNW